MQLIGDSRTCLKTGFRPTCKSEGQPWLTRTAHTLESFVSEKYREWAEANQSSHAETLRRITSFNEAFGNKKLPEITAWMIEKHRSARLKAGVSASTVNRDLDALRGAFTKAIEWGVLRVHPMTTVKRTKIDELERVRYLSPEEDKRLRDALDARDVKRRLNRENFNQWRRERGYKTFPDYGAFTDHLKLRIVEIRGSQPQILRSPVEFSFR